MAEAVLTREDERSPQSLTPIDGPVGTPAPSRGRQALERIFGSELRTDHFPDVPTHSIEEQARPSTPPTARIAQTAESTPRVRHERRRSVQFSQSHGDGEESPANALSRTGTWEAGDKPEDQALNSRQPKFFKRFKALATPTGTGPGRTLSALDTSFTPTGEEPLSSPIEAFEAVEATEDGIEADEEDSDDPENVRSTQPRPRRKVRRPGMTASESSPVTPKASRFSSFMRDHQIPGSSARPTEAQRRATTAGASDHARAGVSEDEGRDRIRNAWRRGIEGARELSSAVRKNPEEDGTTPKPKRPGNLRRLTGFGTQDSNSSTPFRMRADRQNSLSAQKWRQVKAGLKMLGQRKKDERMKIDHQKSAQLMAELLAGAPAALFFASMFQRDEHQHRKVPVLLEQLKISIPDVHTRTDKKGDRDFIFQVDLAYGNGPTQMRWTIHRSVNDFVNLHVKYKAKAATDKVRHLRGEDKTKPRIPRFPKSVIPYARGMRGLFEKLQDEEEEADAAATAAKAAETGTPTSPRPKGHKRRQSSFAPPRRTSTSDIGATSADPDTLNARQRQLYADRSRQKLETYLQQMIRWLIFRPDSTRLCKFLELSAMAIRLSIEGGYQGKQGLLQIASRRHRELNRKILEGLGPHAFKERHKRRWFLVRHSYIVCVDGPESLNPYDVFLVDSDFAIEKRKKLLDQNASEETAKIAEHTTPGKKAHLIRLYNSERKLRLYARNEKQYLQFKESLTHMMNNTVWSQKQRFGSFAPVRNNVWARWLVDGRDHMWQVSRAIDNAKDFVYIHDWWLSPELYLRRPAAISQKWRLDRLLQRKAQEGVKIFVIVYRNIESAIPIDSEYTKWSLLDLHENICIQRSPNQFRQNQFFWAHHEKLVVVDNMMAFVGGVDLCFGRWDDPCHSLTDDKLTGFELNQGVPRDSEHCQVWPGKDYSNPRVQDFYALHRPYEEMYDRTKVPRMPWHDISMQMVGQPARDVGRHFVQRWNYILRSRVPSRPTPVLMPPPEYEEEELEHLGMTGTCQIQILRSCSPWSIGTPNKVEHSIMNAYCALIRGSEHFVYIENQFYISSCTVEGTTIHNSIGDAIVERAIQAHENKEQWQCCLIIPLMPGFQNSVDAQDGTSVRLIMQCQYRSICRGDTSIFGRLRAHGIDPEQYVRFYSLRQWGKIGPRKCLTTEQLYIHAKIMVVDDRTAIIGSANINERSMLGSRDSEVASIVTDTHLLPSFMGGKPYEVGEFPHTLRKRLMREHLGLDVDAIYRREQSANELDQEAEMDRIYRDEQFVPSKEYFETPPATPHLQSPPRLDPQTFVDTLAAQNAESSGWTGATTTYGSSVDLAAQEKHDGRKDWIRDHDVDGYGFDNMKQLVDAGDTGFRDSYVDSHGREVLLRKDAPDSDRIRSIEERNAAQMYESKEGRREPVRPPWPLERLDTVQLGFPTRSQLPELPVLDDTDIGGPPLTQGSSEAHKAIINPLMQGLRRPDVHEDCMTDPLASGFYHDIWHRVAENNTKLYRQVFRCMPDSEVIDWKAYAQFNDYNERFMQAQGLGGASKPRPAKDAPGKSGPPGYSGTPDIAITLEDKVSKGGLASLVDKLRPGSRMSKAEAVDATNTAAIDEKKQDGRRIHAPSPPGSRASSVPTAVPSMDNGGHGHGHNHGHAFNEKDAEKAIGADDEKSASLLHPPTHHKDDDPVSSSRPSRNVQYSEEVHFPPAETTSTQQSSSLSPHVAATLAHSTSQKRRRRATTKSSARPMPEEVLGRDEAEDLLKLVQGHLVLWPYDWLEKEERSGNWLYSIDQLAPLEIYD